MHEFDSGQFGRRWAGPVGTLILFSCPYSYDKSISLSLSFTVLQPAVVQVALVVLVVQSLVAAHSERIPA
jgi:hypothetical protein